MSTETPQQYLVGQIVNGHRLGADGAWHPVDEQIATVVPGMPVPPATLAEILAPSTKKSYGKRVVVGLVVGLTLLILGGIVAAAAGGGKSGGSSSSSTDLTNPTVLAQSVKATYQDRITKAGVAGEITDVTCVATAAEREFKCLLTGTNGDGTEETFSHTVTVASDHSTWVADHE